MKRNFVILSQLSLILCTSGCVDVQQRGAHDKEPLPASFLLGEPTKTQSKNDDQMAHPSNEQTEHLPFWIHWHPELDQLITRFKTANQSLLQENRKIKIAELQAEIQHANGEPKLNYSATGTTSYQKLKSQSGLTNRSLSLGATASWEVDLWGELKSVRKNATLAFELSEIQKSQIEFSLEADLVSSWIQYLFYCEDQQLLLSQIDEQKSLLDITEARFRQGLATAQDVWQQRESYFNLKKENTPLPHKATSQLRNINLLTGEESSNDFERKGLQKIPKIIHKTYSSLPIEVLSQRPDIQMAWNKLQQADQNLFQAQVQRYPSLNLSASSMFTSTKGDPIFNNWLNQLSAGLLGPIYDGNARKNAAKIAQEKVHLAVLEYSQTVRKAFNEICDRLEELQQNGDQDEWLEAELNARQKVLEESEKRYHLGQESATNIWRFRQSYFQIQRQALAHKVSILMAQIAVQRSLGPYPEQQQ